MPTLQLDPIQTVALAAVVLFVGYGIRRRVTLLDRFNIPAPVIGGFAFALLALALRQSGLLTIEFDAALQTPFMIAFFTTIGLGASVALLRRGGPQVLVFWLLASLLAIVQNGVGIGIAQLLGVDLRFGLIAGSITMTGGHGTGAAFGKLLEEQYQLSGAMALAMAAATFGLVAGGLLGGPVGTRLMHRHGLRSAPAPTGDVAVSAVEAAALDAEIDTEPAGEAPTAYSLLQMIAVILGCMALGGVVSQWAAQYVTLPAYIGAMLVAAVARNVFETSRLVRISARTIDDLGTIALALFLTMALMTLRLWELFDLAVPMLVILAAQVVVMAAFARWITFRLMGRDYDAAVMASGHCGFGMGATPTAVANMKSLVERFGDAPRAFLVLPMVGAFFIDFSNAVIITTFINMVKG
ncbi:MAG TPA: sodium/glutamate symporter [Gemmatimonadaceae bacterium]|nr:MAG: sodium/glutamate symporter [Gemmatimonadetes bacterium SCN 70-22]HMN07441.1 sodium/glutamate symporter [Gemmatimonadaceae bacterium]